MKKISKLFTGVIMLILICLSASCTIDYSAYDEKVGNLDPLTITFIEFGNNNSGDSIFIQNKDFDILVDAGSNTSNLDVLRSYLNEHVLDNKLEYVVVTHAHKDHYANFAGTGNEQSSLFYYYETDNIIEFTKTNQSDTAKMYSDYVRMRNAEVANGAKLCSSYQSYNNLNGCTREIVLNDNTKIEILNNYYNEHNSSSENDYSVCFLLTHYNHKFLFTGDLEANGEKKLTELNTLPEVDLYKAGHHGSKTSSSDDLLNVIKPKNVVITCVAGNLEYATNLNNTFPSKDALANIAKYTDKVYVTTKATIRYDDSKGKYVDDTFSSMNGTITVTSTKDNLEIHGSNNDTILKETEWYSNYYQNYRNSEYPWD